MTIQSRIESKRESVNEAFRKIEEKYAELKAEINEKIDMAFYQRGLFGVKELLKSMGKSTSDHSFGDLDESPDDSPKVQIIQEGTSTEDEVPETDFSYYGAYEDLDFSCYEEPDCPSPIDDYDEGSVNFD